MRDKREFYGQCVRASSMLPMQWLGGRQFVYLGGQQVVHGTSCQGLPGGDDTDNKVWWVRSSEVR